MCVWMKQFPWKASHLDSLWNRGREMQLGNRLLSFVVNFQTTFVLFFVLYESVCHSSRHKPQAQSCVWRHNLAVCLVSTLTSSRIKPLVNFLYLWSSLTNSHWWCFGRPTKLLSPWFLVAFCAKSCSSFLERIPLWFIILYIPSHLYWRLRIGSRVFDEISCEQCRRVSINWHHPTSPRSRVRCNAWWESMTWPFF